MRTIAIILTILLVMAGAGSAKVLLIEGEYKVAALSGYEMELVSSSCTGGADGLLYCNNVYKLKFIYLDAEDPPDFVPTKDNAFKTSCVGCHAKETDDKYEYGEWNDDGKGQRNHDKHEEKRVSCTACHK